MCQSYYLNSNYIAYGYGVVEQCCGKHRNVTNDNSTFYSFTVKEGKKTTNETVWIFTPLKLILQGKISTVLAQTSSHCEHFINIEGTTKYDIFTIRLANMKY